MEFVIELARTLSWPIAAVIIALGLVSMIMRYLWPLGGPIDRPKEQGHSEVMKLALTSKDFRASAAAITATLIGIGLVAFLQKAVGIGESATIVTLLLVPLFVYGIVSGRLRELTGPGGWGAKFAELETEIEKTKDQVKQQQELINNLVKYGMSASIFHHLCGIALLWEYIYQDNPPNRREMYFLRDNGFLKPKSGAFLDFDDKLYDKNLVDLAEPTPIGWDCVKLRKNEIPSDMLEEKNKNNLRIDPSNL